MRNFTIYLTLQSTNGNSVRTELNGANLSTTALLTFLTTSTELLTSHGGRSAPMVESMTVYVSPEATDPDA